MSDKEAETRAELKEELAEARASEKKAIAELKAFKDALRLTMGEGITAEPVSLMTRIAGELLKRGES